MITCTSKAEEYPAMHRHIKIACRLATLIPIRSLTVTLTVLEVMTWIWRVIDAELLVAATVGGFFVLL